MKRIVSVSIGASSRDKAVVVTLRGEPYNIERIGTDGSIRDAIRIIGELDGKVTAFGMGGIDLHLSAGKGKRYVLRDALPIMHAAKVTPIVDGTGVKNTLEGRIVKYLADHGVVDFKGRKALITSAIDRFALAESLVDAGCDIIIGDLIFALGLPIPIKKLKTLEKIADVLMPVLSRVPFGLLYPTGEKQKSEEPARYMRYYSQADIIAGDFHYVRKYMPMDMSGKIVITNTVTDGDVREMKQRGVHLLVTTTPEFDGRSFGTNVLEALLVGVTGKKPEELCDAEYYSLFDTLGLKPRIEYLNG